MLTENKKGIKYLCYTLGRKLNIDTTINFEFLRDNHIINKVRISLLEGGSRSGKTWAIILFLFIYLLIHKNKGKIVIIARDYLVTLKKTILPDFIEILKLYGVYKEENHHKSEHVYTLFGNTIRFIGLDNVDTAHGAKCDILWINEAISANKDIFLQLLQRCALFAILDYNPSYSKHWVYDLEKRDDTNILKTTVLDNPFAPEEIQKQILSYEPTKRNIEVGTANEFMWKVYGLGMRADGEALIFQEGGHYDIIDSLPTSYDRVVFGVDFGYSINPAAGVLVILDGNNLYLHEVMYDTGLLNSHILDILLPICGDKVVVPDSAEPKSCDELLWGGLNVVKSDKGADSVLFGINLMKTKKLHITSTSTNLIYEFKNYTFVKDKRTGLVTDKTVKTDDHGIDAARYAVMFLLKNRNEIIF